MDKVRECNKAVFWPGLMDEEHGCEVAHALNVANIRSEVLEST